MTMILTVVSSSVVFQVSDRRMSYLHSDGSTSVRDDTSNKAVLYCNRVTFAYTGFGELEGQRTDLWIAHKLAAASTLADGFASLRDSLTALFTRTSYRGHAHTVVAGGWKFEKDGGLVPFYAIISNMYRDAQWLARPKPDFHWAWESAPARSFGLFEAPVLLRQGEHNSLIRNLRRTADRSLNITNAIRLLVEAIRKTADRVPTVGKSLMLMTLPKEAVRQQGGFLVAVSSAPLQAAPTFLYLPEDFDEFEQAGPTFVCEGGVLTNFRAGPLTR